MPPHLSEVVERLGGEAIRASYDEAVSSAGGLGSLIRQVNAVSDRRLDGADLAVSDVDAWLAGVPIDGESKVTVLWPFDRLAVSIPYRLFRERFEDLWQPSSDDVVVIEHDGDVANVLVIDHEEQFTFASIAGSAR